MLTVTSLAVGETLTVTNMSSGPLKLPVVVVLPSSGYSSM